MPAQKPKRQTTNNLRQIRVKEGLKATELASAAGLSDRIIRDIERGRQPGGEVTRNKIINALNQNPRRVRQKKYELEEVFPPNQS